MTFVNDSKATNADATAQALAVYPRVFWIAGGRPKEGGIEPLARAAGVELVWRPFLLGPVFLAQGWNDSPFNIYPPKGRYMWRDLARLAARYGLPLRMPSRFPRNGVLAARVALGL